MHQFVISEYETYKILNNLDPSKATGPDGIGNRLLKEAAIAISEPLSKLFQISLNQGIYPTLWKQASVTALHKKGSIYDCNNYRPISLLPCVSKVFEKLVFNHMYSYLIKNNLISPNQSGFRPGDSTVRQLVSICHKISQSLDNGDEVLGVFLDFKKAFDKVWHKGLVFKLSKMGFHGSMLRWLKDYLHDRKQRVVIDGKSSTYRYILAGVPQGSVLGPLLFLVYINDICVNLKSIVQLYADDTSLFRIVRNRNMISAVLHINNDLNTIYCWAHQWLVEVSIEKSVSMLISRKQIPTQTLPVKYGNVALLNVEQYKHLGLWFDAKLSWSIHIEHIVVVASKRINMMLALKHKLPRNVLENIYRTFVRPVMEYGDVIFDSCSENMKSDLEKLQIRAAQIVTGAKRYTSNTLLYEETGWTPLSTRRKIHKLILFQQIVHHSAPPYLIALLPRSSSTRNTRQTNRLLETPFRCRTESFKRSFLPSAITLWNNDLNDTIREIINKSTFKHTVRKLLETKQLSELQHYWYYVGDRKSQIVLSQMRLNFSNLNEHLYNKNCVDSPICSCGHGIESVHHFFFACTRYFNQRAQLYRSMAGLSVIIQPSVSNMICGTTDISIEDNLHFLSIIQKYIRETNRF
jgi:hypothetical protein